MASDSEDDIPIAQLKSIRRDYKPSKGEIVEVFWMGEGKWFEGEVIAVKRGMYRVHYKADSEKLWHDKSARVRLAK